MRLKQETQKQYEAIMGPGLKAMSDLVQNEISATLETFVPSAMEMAIWKCSSVATKKCTTPACLNRLLPPCVLSFL